MGSSAPLYWASKMPVSVPLSQVSRTRALARAGAGAGASRQSYGDDCERAGGDHEVPDLHRSSNLSVCVMGGAGTVRLVPNGRARGSAFEAAGETVNDVALKDEIDHEDRQHGNDQTRRR